MQPDDTKRPIALVIGGARGIGLAVGHELANAGWQAVLADIDVPGEADPEKFNVHFIDISRSDVVDDLAAQLLNTYGPISGVVNAAGYNRHSAIRVVDDDVWTELLDLHVGGVVRTCRAFYPALKRTSGAVVNFSSIGGRIGRPNRAPYAAAKAGVEGLTRTLAIEWATDNIRVNAVVPGIINTRMVRENIEKGLVDARSLEQGIPLGRFGEPSDVAQAVSFLLSEKAGYITGQTLVVDGGVLANGNF